MATKGKLKAKAKTKPKAKVKNVGGRPSKLKEIDDEKGHVIALMYQRGFIDKEVASILGVARQTLYNWKKKNDKFLDTQRKSKDIADAKVQQALFERACGYSHPDVHISTYMGYVTITKITKHYPPDTSACFIWLKNRKPEDWSDRIEKPGPAPEDAAKQMREAVFEMKKATNAIDE